MKQTSQNSKGITLIALVITIIVLLILAGVTIATLTGDNGILNKAQSAKTQNYKATAKEKVDLAIAASLDETGKINLEQLKTNLNNVDGINPKVEEDLTDSSFPLEVTVDGTKITITKDSNGKYSTSVGESTGSSGDGTSGISKTESYIGYYADINDDGTIDGVIYADQAVGGSGQWGNEDGTYRIPKVEASELKEYKIRTSKFPDGVAEDVFKTGKTTSQVIAPVSKDSKLKDRFYVMALSDISSNYYYWNKNYDDYYNSEVFGTEYSFGKGKSNTKIMVEYWEKNPGKYIPIIESGYDEYGEHFENQTGTEYVDDWDSEDIWYNIKDEVAKGWFVPSKEEWSAFAGELKISKTSSDDKNYSKLGLRIYYWSSSQYSNDYYSRAWLANFDNGGMGSDNVGGNFCVRLGTTF